MNVRSPEHDDPEYADPVPVWLRSSTLSLRLFGPFRALVHGRPLPKTRSRREVWLLALLALRADAPVERAWLAGVLWPDALDEKALYNLRRNLHGLRDALGPEADRLLAPTPRTLRLDLTGADCDLADFDAALRQGDEASLRQAAALYRGPLLLGCQEEWAFPEREARERAVLGVLERLAGSARERGEWPEAAAWLGQALAIDPLRETAVRGLMGALAAQGRHAAAGEACRAFRRRLRDELNADPDPETLALYRRLQAEARQPAPAETAPPVPALPPADPATEAAHLPAPLTPLIGREREAEAVAAALDGARLVTLTGAGGVGKTRLALAVAHALAPEREGGVWFADLAPLSDPTLLVSAVAAALGVREQPGRPLDETLREWLKPRRLLLVLDNCEQVAHDCAHLALGLLRDCPGLTLLATSRETLRVPGEAVFRVPGLPEGDAVRLFAARAAQAGPAFRLTPANADLAARICRRLDGIPLAIEMAAARARVLPLAQIATRLDDAFRLLTEPGGDLLPRHRDAAGDPGLVLRPAVRGREDAAGPAVGLPGRLDAGSRRGRLRRRGGGGCMSGIVVSEDVLDLLASLVDKSLVVYEEQADGTGRYRLLETVRQYAHERLAEGGGAEAMAGRHAAWFLALAEQAEPELTGPEQTAWLARLETDHDNLRAALAWYEQRPEGAADGLRLAAALWRFWYMRGHLAEGRLWLGRALERSRHESDAHEGDAHEGDAAVRARALNGAGSLAYSQGDHDVARALYGEGLVIKRRLGDQRGVATLLHNLGNVISIQGDLAGARAIYEEVLLVYRRLDDLEGIASSLASLGNVARSQSDYVGARDLYGESLTTMRRLDYPQGIAASLHNLGVVAHEQGDYMGARALYEESLGIFRRVGDQQGIARLLLHLGNLARSQCDDAGAGALYEEGLVIRRRLGDQRGIAMSLNNLGNLASAQGDLMGARALYEECLTTMRRLGDPHGIAFSLHNLGNVARYQRNYLGAVALYEESLVIRQRLGDRRGIADILEGLAAASHGQGQSGRAARLGGAASSLRQSIGCPPEPEDREAMAAAMASAADALGEAAFAAAWAEGQVMRWEQAVEYALAEDGPTP